MELLNEENSTSEGVLLNKENCVSKGLDWKG